MDPAALSRNPGDPSGSWLEAAWDSVFHWWFWQPFWPTVLGVALGIPVALWLYNFSARAAAARAVENDDNRRRETVEVLRETLGPRVTLLEQAASRPDDSVETVTSLQAAVWDAVRGDAFRLFPAPQLRGRLASHFERVARLNAAHEQRTQRILARKGQAQWSDTAPMEAEIHATLRAEAAAAAEEASALVQELQVLEDASHKEEDVTKSVERGSRRLGRR